MQHSAKFPSALILVPGAVALQAKNFNTFWCFQKYLLSSRDDLVDKWKFVSNSFSHLMEPVC
jgi:hypothetical protein